MIPDVLFSSWHMADVAVLRAPWLQVFRALDTNGDGNVSRAEFIKAVRRPQRVNKPRAPYTFRATRFLTTVPLEMPQKPTWLVLEFVDWPVEIDLRALRYRIQRSVGPRR